VQLLNSILYKFDVEEVPKIRLSEIMQEDYTPWFYEKSSIVSVKSACLLRMQAGGLAPKSLLSIITHIKLRRNQGDACRRPCVEHTFDTIKRDNLRMHQLTNQPPYFVISCSKVETGPMAEASDTLAGGGPSVSRRPEEERGGIDETEGPSSASNGGLT
jgi:hypothetical protein